MSRQMTPNLSYQPYSSILHPGFWQQLTNVKLNTLKLNTSPIDIFGSYSFGLNNDLPCLASFDHNSFNQHISSVHNRTTCPMRCRLVCLNVLQEMIDYDKKGFLETIGDEIWTSITNGTALVDPENNLSRSGLLVFADLKKYKYTYWFAFPAINYPLKVSHVRSIEDTQQQLISSIFSNESLMMFKEQFDAPSTGQNFQKGYFLMVHNAAKEQIFCLPLHKYHSALLEYPESKIYFAFSDPCADEQYPGWPLRNYLALIAVQFQLKQISIIRIRRDQSSDYRQSYVLELELELDDRYKPGHSSATGKPMVTGWERNETERLAPKQVNLSNLLDPTILASDAVNLNLKLMKWRLMPNLDLERISKTRCLLLGCGTLGCHIARGLLAWGIKHISIVDNSKISYSNPVRQTLYTFEDCLNGSNSIGLFKAETAARSLKKIHPNIDVKAHVFSIPMPGHHVGEDELESTRGAVEELETLIDAHDVIFLLMDTRESRWLPTVIAMSKQKLVINAAIGFDTFLLQRFGIRQYCQTDAGESTDETVHDNTDRDDKAWLASDKLGCYFCNDIVAPGDSTLDRTLDQQCTVSRPGVSMMVSALAVEFLASILSSPKGSQTPAPVDVQNDPSKIEDEYLASELGLVPHSVRGNMSRYHIYMPTSPSFNKCSACSSPVVRSYLNDRFEFLLRVFNEPSYLEEIAGLKDLKNVSDDVWAFDSDEMPPSD